MRIEAALAVLFSICGFGFAAGQSSYGTEDRSYAGALREADAVYAKSRLALTNDGRWLAVTTPDGVIVMPTEGGARQPVPVSNVNDCHIAWNEQGLSLALNCRSDRRRVLFIWQRGAPAVEVVDSSVAGTPVAWLPGGRSLAYTKWRAAESMTTPDRAEPARSSSRATTPCVPRKIQPRPVVFCSDTVDVLRSPALEEALIQLRGSAEPVQPAESSPNRLRGEYEIVHVDLIDGRQTVLGRVPGEHSQLRATADGGGILVMVTDSTTSSTARTYASIYRAKLSSDSDASRVSFERILEGEALQWNYRTQRYALGWSADSRQLAWWPSEPAELYVPQAADSLYVVAVDDPDAVATAIALPRRSAAARGSGELIAPELIDGYAERPLPKWTTDGTRVVIAVHGTLWVVDADGTRVRSLTGDDTPDVQRVLLVSDEHALVATLTRGTGRSGLWRVDLATGAWVYAGEYDRSRPSSLTATGDPDAANVAYVATTRSTPSNVYSVRTHDEDVVSTRLTTAAAAISLPASHDTVIMYRVSDRVPGTAVIVRPAGAHGPLPTIVYGYPGGRAASLTRHRPGLGMPEWVYEALDRGYAVMRVDVPMTPAGIYGEDGPSEAMTKGMHAALIAAFETGWVDTTRLGVMGHSYGGLMVNVLVGRMPDRFDAAVSLSGPSNLVSAVYGGGNYGPDWFATGQARMEAAFREDPYRYLDNSPVLYIERIRTPLLLIHGFEDQVVGINQSEDLFYGLSQLGRRVEFVRYRKLGHVIGPPGWKRALDWFDTFLKKQH